MPGVYDLEQHSKDPQSVNMIFNILFNLPKQFESKDWMINQLVLNGISTPIAQWLATNIIPLKNSIQNSNLRFEWGFDLEGIHELFYDFCSTDKWSFLESYSGSSTIHFLRAGKNNAWNDDILNKFAMITSKNSNIKLHKMPHVGHWLHAEDPNGMLNIIQEHSFKAM